MSIGLPVSILVPFSKGQATLVIIEPQRGFAFRIQVIGFHDELAIFEEAVDFWNAVAIPVHGFFAGGAGFFIGIEDVGVSVLIQVIGFGLVVGGWFGPRQLGACFGAVEAQEAHAGEQKNNPSVFGFAHRGVVTYP